MTATSCPTKDVLLHVIVTLLTPIFLPATGDLDQAYAAALATVRSCTARNPLDLLLIGQVIAFGLATLNSVSLSMDDDIPLNLILRLRGNAVSLHRASDRCRRALPEPDPTIPDEVPLTAAELQHEAEVVAEVERCRQRAAEFQAGLSQHQATPVPAPILPANVPTSHHAIARPPASNLESHLRAAYTRAFPEATKAEIDTIIEDAIVGSQTASTRAPPPTPA